jgi:hypothetical protein
MEETMGYRSRQEYVRTQAKRYKRADRAEKKKRLDEGCKLFGLHRKSLIRALTRGQSPGHRVRAGRKPVYDAALLRPLKTVWLKSRQPCAKRLKALLPHWLPSYERRHGRLDEAARAQLLRMSAATMDRALAPVRAKLRKGLSGTRSAHFIEGQIPIRTHFQDVAGPGWFEADTVAHCGTSATATNRLVSPAAALIAKTIMRMWSKSNGRTCASFSAMTASMTIGL